MEILGEQPTNVLSSEHMSIFHQGANLQKEMINAEAVMEITSQKISPIRGGTKRVNELEMTRNMNNKQKKQVKQRKWGKIIKDLEKNPKQLMEIIPTPRNNSQQPYGDTTTLQTSHYETKKSSKPNLLSTIQKNNKLTLSSKSLVPKNQQSTFESCSNDPYGDINKPQMSLFSSNSRPDINTDPYGNTRYMPSMRNNSSNSH